MDNPNLEIYTFGNKHRVTHLCVVKKGAAIKVRQCGDAYWSDSVTTQEQKFGYDSLIRSTSEFVIFYKDIDNTRWYLKINKAV